MNENSNRDTDPTADVQPAKTDALDDAIQDGQYNQRVRIHIHSVRKGTTDPDGISAKAAIDGIVKAGLLKDDSPKEIKESPRFTQERGKVEKTIITIESCDD